MVSKQTLEDILAKLTTTGRSSSRTHLRAALYEWNKEQQWASPNAFILDHDTKGFIFFTFTTREPKHCTLRHVFVLEEFRGQKIASKLMDQMYEQMRRSRIERLRFFADLPSVRFYEKLGYEWHGNSKTGLPFFYGTIDPIAKLELPRTQQRFIIPPRN